MFKLYSVIVVVVVSIGEYIEKLGVLKTERRARLAIASEEELARSSNETDRVVEVVLV